jgi:hypothetical protein
MNNRTAIEGFRRLSEQMIILGVFLFLIALILGLATGGLAQGAVVAIAVERPPCVPGVSPVAARSRRARSAKACILMAADI